MRRRRLRVALSEQEALKKAEEEKEAQRQRLEKKAERERRKAEQRQKKEEQQLRQHQQLMNEMRAAQLESKHLSKGETETAASSGSRRNKSRGCCSMLLTVLILAASMFSALVVYSFYKHKYPLTWPYLRDVTSQHLRSVQVYTIRGWEAGAVHVQLWTKKLVQMVQSLSATKDKN